MSPLNSKFVGIALLGALLTAAPCFAQPDQTIDPQQLPADFAEMPAMVPVGDRAVSMLPDRYGESVTLNVPQMGSVTITLTKLSLFDVKVALDTPVEVHGGRFSQLWGIGFLDVDPEGNGGDSLQVVLYPAGEPTALPAGGSRRGLSGALAGDPELDVVTEEILDRFSEDPIEMVIRTDGVELVLTCPTILGQIMTAGEEALAAIAEAGRRLGHGIVRVVQTSIGVAIVFGYLVAEEAVLLFQSAARVLKRVFVEIGKGAKHVFVDVLARQVIVNTLAKRVFRDILAKKVFRDFIGKTVFRDVLAKKVFRDAVYGTFMRDWIWNGGIRRIGRFFAREFGGRTKRVSTTFGAPQVESSSTSEQGGEQQSEQGGER